MASPLEATPALNYNLATKAPENGCELTAMLRPHLGIVQKDDTNSQFGYLFDKISHSLASSREILTKSDQNLVGSTGMSSQLLEGAKTTKRRRDDKFNNQRRKRNNIRTELTRTPFHDGYQWTKYGQKNIHAQKYPRCYYRCTYHSDRNCKATKQVQQYNDEYAPLFEVAYFDEHTCNINIPNSKATMNENILDFSGNSISRESMLYRNQDEEAALVSCLTHVVRGYSSGISENANGGQNQVHNSNESSSTMDDDVSSIESTLFRQDEFHQVVHGITMDLEWLEQDSIQFLLDSFAPI